MPGTVYVPSYRPRILKYSLVYFENYSHFLKKIIESYFDSSQRYPMKLITLDSLKDPQLYDDRW